MAQEAKQAVLLVTGATGRLGHMLRAAWALKPPVGLAPLWQARRGGADLVAWDMLADQPPPALTTVDVVLNLAGVTPSSTGAGRLADNAALALAACRLARQAGTRHVFLVSTAAVYAPGNFPMDEDTPPAPPNPYGIAKLEMERAARAWRQAAGPGAPGLTFLRIGNVAGADALLAPRRRALELDDFPGQPGAGPLRSYIGPLTLARVLAALARTAARGQTLPEVLNIAAPGQVAMADLAQPAGLAVTLRPARPDAVARMVLDTRRLQALVPFAPDDGAPAAMVAQWRGIGGHDA